MASEAQGTLTFGRVPLQSKSQKYAPEAAHAKAITRKTQGKPGMPSAPVYLWERETPCSLTDKGSTPTALPDTGEPPKPDDSPERETGTRRRPSIQKRWRVQRTRVATSRASAVMKDLIIIGSSLIKLDKAWKSELLLAKQYLFWGASCPALLGRLDLQVQDSSFDKHTRKIASSACS